MQEQTPLKVTCRVYPLEDPQGALKATASITVNDAISVRDVRVMEGKNGLFVSMPSTKSSFDKYFETAHPVTAVAREQISAAVLGQFEFVKQNGTLGQGDAQPEYQKPDVSQVGIETRVFALEKPFKDKSTGLEVKAFASVTIDDVFVVKSLRVLENKHGDSRIGFPERPDGNGGFKEVAFALGEDLRDAIQKSVKAQYMDYAQTKDAAAQEAAVPQQSRFQQMQQAKADALAGKKPEAAKPDKPDPAADKAADKTTPDKPKPKRDDAGDR